MKLGLFIFLSLSLVIISCKKDNVQNPTSDYRDGILGDYTGIRIYTHWQDTIVGFQSDTTLITLRISKGNTDSTIQILSSPDYVQTWAEFNYSNELIICTDNYHPPLVTKEQDSLKVHWQPSLAPNTFDYKTKKQ